MKIKQITESSVGATASGSVASVAKPLGKMQERTNIAGLQPAEKVMKGKAKKKGPYANSTLAEAKKKDKAIAEAELAEQDLIIVPGMRKTKDKSFISHKDDRRDHEVEMARSDLLAAAKNAMRMYHLLKDRTEDQGLMGWQQSYITLATDYLQSVADNLEYDARTDEMTGGVLAGGMSNFEEGVAEGKEDLSQYSTEQLKAYHDKHWGGGVPTFGKGALLKRIQAELKRRQQGVAEGAPKLLKKEIPLHRHVEKLLALNGVSKDDPDYHHHLGNTITYLRKFGNIDLINKSNEQGVEEGKAEVRADLDQAIRDYLAKGGEITKGKPGGPTTRKQQIRSLVKNLGSSHIGKRGESPRGDKVGKGANLKGSTVAKLSGGMSKVAEEKCPHCGGEMVSEELMNEKKDACYYKVKSRYKVWPSAYASGALVKCRKKGSKNWGKSK